MEIFVWILCGIIAFVIFLIEKKFDKEDVSYFTFYFVLIACIIGGFISLFWMCFHVIGWLTFYLSIKYGCKTMIKNTKD